MRGFLGALGFEAGKDAYNHIVVRSFTLTFIDYFRNETKFMLSTIYTDYGTYVIFRRSPCRRRSQMREKLHRRKTQMKQGRNIYIDRYK